MSKSHLCTVKVSNFSLSKLQLLQCVWHRYQVRMKIWVSRVQYSNKCYSKISKSKQVPLYFYVSGVSLSKLLLLQCVLHGCQGCMKIWVSKVQCTNKSCSKKNKNMQMPLYLVLSNFFDILSLYIMSCWGCIKTQVPLYLILECPKYPYVL